MFIYCNPITALDLIRFFDFADYTATALDTTWPGFLASNVVQNSACKDFNNKNYWLANGAKYVMTEEI